MRRTIGYTGRKKLDRSDVDVKLEETENGKRVSLVLANHSAFDSMPTTCRVNLRLFEGQYSENITFGTLGEVRNGVEPVELENHEAFSAPSAQLRLVEAEGERCGLVRGSTNRWRLRMEGEDSGGEASSGILPLRRMNIAPQVWILDIQENSYPTLYIDASIHDPYSWAESNTVFASCVLPVVVRDVFNEIFDLYSDTGQQWVTDWIDWAEDLLKTNFDPNATDEDRKEWIEDLIKAFCRQHNFLGKLIYRLEGNRSK